MRRRKRILLLAGTMLAFASTGATTAQADWTWSAWVQPGQEKSVRWNNYVVRSDDFGGRTTLYNPGDSTAGFQIIGAINTHVWDAYPEVFRGCTWGICSLGGWPLRIRDDGVPRATLVTTQTWTGQYDTSFDNWFSTYPNKVRQSNGAEVMIWLSHPGLNVSGWPVVTIDGTRWSVMHWRPCKFGACWNFVAYVRVHQVSAAYGLWLNPFFRDSEARGLLRSSWWWTSVEAGFELCRGGRGLGIDYFRVSK